MYPFINKMNISDSDLAVISPHEFAKLKFSSYRYNNLLVSVLANMRGEQENTGGITGYTPLPPTNNIFEKDTVQFEKVDAVSLQYFSAIVNLCRQNNFRLIVFISPYYEMVIANKTAVLAEQFCSKNGIAFYNYSNNNLLPLTKGNFKDNLHLNATGSDKFTNDFINKALQ